MNEYLIKYGLPTIEEWEAAVKIGVYENNLELYEMFLTATDHIPNKIIEKLIEDLATATTLNFITVFIDFIKSVRVEYKDVLAYRKQARDEINKLENLK